MANIFVLGQSLQDKPTLTMDQALTMMGQAGQGFFDMWERSRFLGIPLILAIFLGWILLQLHRGLHRIYEKLDEIRDTQRLKWKEEKEWRKEQRGTQGSKQVEEKKSKPQGTQQPTPPPETNFAFTFTPEPLTAKAPDISIHDAAIKGDIEAVKQHMAAGMDVNAKDNYGRTPLHGASNKEIAELLIVIGADVYAKNKWEVTPLHWAAREGRMEVAELLIAKGADVNAKDDKGGTPLHIAASWGHKETAELLIDKGADLKAKMNNGETPLDWAIRRKYTEIADLLRKHGGKTGGELKAEGK